MLFSIPKPQICIGVKSDVFRYEKLPIKLKNPILRPFRKLDGITEYGIHDKKDGSIKSVVPFLRFDEEQLKNDSRFTKINIEGLQEHEIMLTEAQDKVKKDTIDVWCDMFNNISQKHKKIS